MIRSFHPRWLALAALLLTGIVAQSASAQSTISDQTWDLSFGKGFWGAMLPEYSVGTADGGGAAYRDNLDDIGAIWELGAVRRFRGTRTNLETRGFFALALSNTNDAADSISLESPFDNALVPSPGPGIRHLDADVYHYGFEIALRDTWRTRFGGLSAGAGLSTFAFDQRFNAEFDRQDLFEEDLDSDYFGGIGFVGWDGYLLGQASNLDLTFGYYGFDSEYEFRSRDMRLNVDGGSSDAFKVDLTGTTRVRFDDTLLGLTFGAMYLSDIATIERVDGLGIVVDDSDAVFLTASVDWLW